MHDSRWNLYRPDSLCWDGWTSAECYEYRMLFIKFKYYMLYIVGCTSNISGSSMRVFRRILYDPRRMLLNRRAILPIKYWVPFDPWDNQMLYAPEDNYFCFCSCNDRLGSRVDTVGLSWPKPKPNFYQALPDQRGITGQSSNEWLDKYNCKIFVLCNYRLKILNNIKTKNTYLTST